MKFIIPIRGINTAMSRLQNYIEPNIKQKVIQYLLMQTIQVCQSLQLDITVLTSDQTLISQLQKQNISCFFDTGISLNKAVIDYITIHNLSRIGLIMPDIPQISADSLVKVLHLLGMYDNILVPSIDKGTSVAILNTEFWKQGYLEKQSARKFTEFAIAHQIQLTTVIIDNLQRDLDTYDDWQYFHPEQWVT